MEITLRKWTLDDLDTLVRYGDNPKIAANMRNNYPSPYLREDGIKFINMINEQDPQQVFAICKDGNPVGSMGVFPGSDIHCKNAEMGYWLAEPFWGQGIVAKAIPQLIEYAYKTWDINRIYAIPFGTNIASQRVLEKCGFILEGRYEKTIFKNGEYLDELVYSVRKK